MKVTYIFTKVIMYRFCSIILYLQDCDYVHFVQSISKDSLTKIVRMIKCITERGVFQRVPSVEMMPGNCEFWIYRYFEDHI